jgi:hypothetical protein
MVAGSKSYLIITNDMRDAFVPGNIRALDLAKSLRADNHKGPPSHSFFAVYPTAVHNTLAPSSHLNCDVLCAVVFVSKNGGFAPAFSSEMDALAIDHYSPASDVEYSTDALLQAYNFDAAFLYLWFVTCVLFC